MAKKSAVKRKITSNEIHSDTKEVKDSPPVKQKVTSTEILSVRKTKWINKERVLVFSSRGITFQERHLMLDLRTLLPHSKPESKMEKKDSLLVINEICEMKNCNKCIYFENKKRKDCYMWISNVPRGPSAKFLVESIHTMQELKLTGNCLKGTRPLLSFDKSFNKHPHLSLLKELFIQVFSTPHYHPKSQPFFDHVFNFTYLDNRIWFRNYQIVEESGSLVEIGPRFVLNPIKVFESSFAGAVLYSNPHYIPPNLHRRIIKKEASLQYKERLNARMSLVQRRPKESYKLDTLDEVFTTHLPEETVEEEEIK